jgi:hypothetical protein
MPRRRSGATLLTHTTQGLARTVPAHGTARTRGRTQEDRQMTDTSRRAAANDDRYGDTPTAWAGWVVFGGVMLIMVGAFQIIEGLVALFDDGFYLVGSTGLLVNVDYNTWGWIHTAIGVVCVLAGIGLLAGNMVARVVGIAVACLSALVNLAFISAYPVWSAIMIILDVIVIYAIIVHGRELKGYYR